MDNTQLEKFTRLKEQNEAFTQNLIVERTRLESVREEYSNLVRQLQEKAGVANPQEAMQRLQVLEGELGVINERLVALFAEFEQLSAEE